MADDDTDYKRLEFRDGKVVALSVSKITQFYMCKRKLYFEEILKVRERKNSAAIRGTAVDAAIQKGFLAKASGEKCDVRDMTDFGISVLEEEVKKAEQHGAPIRWGSGMDDGEGAIVGPDECKSDLMRGIGFLWSEPEGVGMLEPHPDAPVQDSFEITFPFGVTMIGTTDLCSAVRSGKKLTGYMVHDVKTSGRTWQKGKEDMSLQPPVYTMGLTLSRGERPVGFDFRVLAFNKVKPTVQTRRTVVTEARLKALPMIVKNAADEIGRMYAANVMPEPTGYLSQSGACNYCGYASRCRQTGIPV